MKIFVIGLEKSGRTTAAKELAETLSFEYIPVSGWLRTSFRDQHKKESLEDYNHAYFEFYSNRIKQNPDLCVEYVNSLALVHSHVNTNLVIDGIESPRDFAQLFNCKEDIAIFLNRTDSCDTISNHIGIGLNVMRDYCLYLSSVGLLRRNQWFEYKFKIPGEDVAFIKELGKHSTVIITKSLNKAMEHFKENYAK